jgi:hypothetical protein
MAEGKDGDIGTGVHQSNRNVARSEARKLRFQSADPTATAELFGTSEGQSTGTSARKQRTIAPNKRAQITANDTRPAVSQEVKGKPPVEPSFDLTDNNKTSDTPRRVGRPSTRKVYPSVDEAKNNAQFLLASLEMAMVTAIGPTGEMTDWERGVLTAPIQRILGRIPAQVLQKGGLWVDIGFVVMGGGLYFGRTLRGIKMPQMGGKRKQGTQEDIQAPQAAPVHQTVNTIQAGDIDGLAQPVPVDITRHMNGAI